MTQMNHVLDALRDLRLWSKEDNYLILQGALRESSDALSRPSDVRLTEKLCRKHLDRLAFYRYLVYHCPLETSDINHNTDCVESEILMKDIETLLASKPSLCPQTLKRIHELDEKLYAILDEE